MRCKALALAALLATGAAWADPPTDAPLAALPLHKGAQAPEDGVFLSTAKALDVAKRCEQAKADREHFRQEVADEPLPSGSLVLGVAVIGVVIGALIGGFAVAVAKK